MSPVHSQPAQRGALNGLIAEYMQRKELSNLKAFAEHAGLSRSTVHDLVRMKAEGQHPSLTTLLRLAEVLEKPTHELLYLLVPDAPGAPTASTDTRRADALGRLRILSAPLVDSETFIATRADDFGSAP